MPPCRPRPVLAGGYPSDCLGPPGVSIVTFTSARSLGLRPEHGIPRLRRSRRRRPAGRCRAGCSSKEFGCSSSCWAPPRASGRRAASVPRPQGLGGMLGCLLGYVAGGILGRLLDRAARRGRDAGSTAARPPGSSPARSARSPGAALALVLVLPFALLLPVPFAVSLAGLAVVDLRLARLPDRRPPERGGARAARPVDAGRSCARRRSTRATACSSTRRW